jgi:GTPase SAR1 family protein
MKLVEQQEKLPIYNIDMDSGVKQIGKNGPLLPNSIRALICGPSGVGKTNLVYCLLTEENGVRFENVYVYSKSLYQPKYIQLEQIMNTLPEISYFTFSNTNEVIPPDEVKNNSVFIFDDVICDEQQKIKEYYSMGRHKGIDCFYLCQTYTKVPKHLIRDNANFIILFKQDELNLKHVYDDHVSPDIEFDEFKKLCRLCWRNKYDFVTIDKERPINEGRYRCGFDVFVNI